VLKGASGGIYSNGRMLFLREGFLMSQPFDIRRGELVDQSISIPYAEGMGGGNDRARPFSSGGNVLAYRTGGASLEQDLMWMDRRGEILEAAAEPAAHNGFSLSPDTSAVAIIRKSEGLDAPELWSFDLRRGVFTRLTFDERGAANPLWAPDGRRVAFASRTQSQTEVRVVTTNGAGETQVLLKAPYEVVPSSWSPDGRFLAYTTSERGKLGISVLQLEAEGKPMALLQGNFNYKQARFSPDGRALAYVSDESGRDEVYVRSFPSDEMRVLVSTEGGSQPQWRNNGRELFYVAPGQILTAVQVEGSRRDVGRPQMLFQLPRSTSAYEVAPDGQRFLVSIPGRGRRNIPVDLVLNWRHDK
jgi:dipeptidyl aminopeptidase/acylaminoacyl peptidase